MAKYNKKVSPETEAEANKIAKATQRPKQTKEQTRLIAQGIQKGIDHYKKQQKAKARELDKKLRKVRNDKNNQQPETPTDNEIPQARKGVLLPWILLGASWLFFLTYAVFLRTS
ncbi:DUF2956 domain-containing protein [Aliikangiella coralliicola]|uniref:DUF2956 domain-containing protein n=1 Tax=Aliikangiella coralliicola TaxID=2592383 RepID=A0A545TW22_9GAMM|nr:DUF2956 domain-containing protein [Aliikangiella coralliicola]TQV81428.1 DUF2956 domain-containing protein [Aliikangiella coralliicola]